MRACIGREDSGSCWFGDSFLYLEYVSYFKNMSGLLTNFHVAFNGANGYLFKKVKSKGHIF